MLPALAVVRRYVLPGRVGMIILSSLVALTGWQWVLDRGQVLATMQWPIPTASGFAMIALWIAGIAFAAGGLRLLVARLHMSPPPAVAPRQTGAAD